MFSGMRYASGSLELLDQRLLPHEEHWVGCRTVEDCARAIEDMVVRGAPAIAETAAFALAMDALSVEGTMLLGAYRPRLEAGIERLARTRPTAVNLFNALREISALIAGLPSDTPMVRIGAMLEEHARRLFEQDLATCRAIGRHGADLVGDREVRVLTHCNTGSLATAGYGTALGVIRALHERDKIKEVYADETRPYLQGARLTAFELEKEQIPFKLIVDSTAAWLMHQGLVDLVVVGADRIAANGDTANKIGTYALAVQCAHHGVPFYVAAPRSTFDPNMPDGRGIPVEERDPGEVRGFGGRAVASSRTPVFNPSFDVTPGNLITGIITEEGVLKPPYRVSIREFLS